MYKKLNRNTNQRKALIRGLAYSLIRDGKLETTLAKAKVARSFSEKLITKAKTNTIASRRNLLKDLPHEDMVDKLLTVVGPKFQDRAGGYLRIVRFGNRIGDNSLVARVEFVEEIASGKIVRAKKTKETAPEAPKEKVENSKNLLGGSKIKVTRKSATKETK